MDYHFIFHHFFQDLLLIVVGTSLDIVAFTSLNNPKDKDYFKQIIGDIGIIIERRIIEALDCQNSFYCPFFHFRHSYLFFFFLLLFISFLFDEQMD